MTGRNVVVIGAGIAGLSAGCYLQMNGYKSKIFELHDISGGLCTSWERKGYTFDGCIHWLVGSSPSMVLYDMWTELGAINEETEIINTDVFVRIEDDKGEHFTIYTDMDKFEAEMLRISPQDEEVIKEFTEAVRFFVSFQCSRDNPPPPEVQMTFRERIPAFIQKWSSITTNDFAEKITNPTLKQFFLKIFGDFVGNTSSIFILVATLGYLHAKTAGYPKGGSKPFAKRIEERYLSLGGEIQFNARVKEIIVENDSATGIILTNGEKINTDIVISAADGFDTIFNMLKGKYVDEEINGYYKNLKLFPSICQVSLGIADELKDYPHSIRFPIKKPIEVDPKTKVKEIGIRIFNFDETLAPKGKTVLTTVFESEDYEYWMKLRVSDRKKYNETKEQLANEIINRLEQRFPGIKSKIDVVDVSTPATFIRYTNNWKGSYEGWLPSKETAGKSITETLPGLNDFFMIGQWTQPGGGLPPAAMSAKKIVSMICKQDGKEFVTKKD
ncbi:MAG TPA: NAD(P)/FAD-dependent oxidoreductase [candidate division Zixibacteria bacterium]|nr:NAD(P)/FAD-dependent oxidoreductase [candidate division Zixibacteria bacterium]